jgi:thiamine biosynthesis lipoprotein
LNRLIFYQQAFNAMGSPCEIQIFAKNMNDAKRAASLAIGDVNRLEAKYSRYRTTSFLSAINRVALNGGIIEVDEETASLLHYADTCHKQSDGLFDITSGVLRKAWNFKVGLLPEPDRIEQLLANIGWDKVRWQPPQLTFPAGMEIDLGGVVKEYAVDRAAALCRQAGINSGVINLGGDIKIIGPRPDSDPWRVGIRHPRNKDGLLETMLLYEGALASSGDYERCIVIEGRRYGHVMNPLTGWPVNYMAAVSVVGEFCVVAGSASTIAMLKEEQGPVWLQELGLPHLWVNVDGEVGGTIK